MRCLLPLVAAIALSGAEPAQPPLNLDAKPAGVTRSVNLWFDDGKPNGGQDSLSVQLTANLPDGVNVLDVQDVTVVEAVTDGGAAVAADPGNTGSGSPGDAAIGININLMPPPAGARLLKRLVVSANVRTAEPGQRQAVIKPANAWIAKRLKIDGYAGAEVELEDLAADGLTIGMTTALSDVLADISFHTAAGADIEHQGWNDHHETGWIARQVQVVLPADGEIRLSLHRGISTRKVVLTALQVPIALPDRNKPAVGSLPTKDLPSGPAGQTVEPAAEPAAAAPAVLTPVP